MACPYESSARKYLAGGLADAERARFEAHLPRCAACARTVAASLRGAPEPPRARPEEAPPTPGTIARGTMVGRYIILSLLGRGGMGEVYSAYDPRLDRKIALKLLRETAGSGAAERAVQERLLSEAQATARLAHRNVVVVYDTGTIDDLAGGSRVYLAMELVDGQTLAAWLTEKRRTWRQVRQVFLAAGEGLQAAHEAGLVHRDFKPQNVMVGRDRTARVLDFGLAGDGAEAPAVDPATNAAPGAQTIALTHTGVFLGTPLYMAPEQFLGRKTDARTDQFSFCVALYEALYGERPFPSGSFSELLAAVSAGQIREAPKRTPVPAFVRRILLRGLQADPDARFPSMRELMATLRSDPLRHRRSVALAAAAAVALLVGGAGAQRVATRGQRMCRGGTEKLQGIWELDANGPRRSDVHRAFVASGSPIADDTWPRVAALLDDYAHRWTAAYTDTCEATHVRGDQSAEVLDLRMTCLDGARGAIRALTDVFSGADARTVIGGVDAIHGLPPIERCADIQALRTGSPLPIDRVVRAEVTEIENGIAGVRTLFNIGKWTEGRTRIGSFIDRARKVGYEPTLAEALNARGWVECQLGDSTASLKTDEEGITIALAARRDDIAVEIADRLFVVYGRDLRRLDESEYWEKLAYALLRRLGSGHERLAAWFHHDSGLVLYRQGNLLTAAREVELGLALKRKALASNDPDIAISLESLANIRTELGEGAAALSIIESALAIERVAYGPHNPLAWASLNNRGEALALLHRYSEAEADLRLSLELSTAVFGANHAFVAYPLTALGKVLTAEGRYGEAERILRRALDLREKGEPLVALVAETRFALAEVQWILGRDRPHAIEMAIAARDAYRQPPSDATHADQVDAWLTHTREKASRKRRELKDVGGLPRR